MKIVIGSGGSGGHLFPALKVAQELKRQGHEVVFVGSFRDTALDKIQKSGFVFENLLIQGFATTWNFAKIFSSLRLMFRGFAQARQFLKKNKPHVVIGFGGYGAFPVVLAALFLRIPTMIHEQNVVPGRANRVLAQGVNRIAISFKEAQRYFKKEKTIVTGCPCNVSGKQIDKALILKEFQLEHNRFTLLVLGGSQGSHRVNETVCESLKIFKSKRPLQVIHLAGAKDFVNLKIRYQELGIPFALFDFLDNMEEAYSVADLIVARAGAVTVTEIAMAQVPAIFIPYPFAGGHQFYNAKVLSEAKVARIIEQKDLSASRLAAEILETIESREILKDSFRNLESLRYPDAAERIARETVELGLTRI